MWICTFVLFFKIHKYKDILAFLYPGCIVPTEMQVQKWQPISVSAVPVETAMDSSLLLVSTITNHNLRKDPWKALLIKNKPAMSLSFFDFSSWPPSKQLDHPKLLSCSIPSGNLPALFVEAFSKQVLSFEAIPHPYSSSEAIPHPQFFLFFCY